MNHKTAIETIRTNIRRLMERDAIRSENALAKMANVDQKTINNLLAHDTLPNPTTKVLAAIATSFRVEPWMLLIQDFPWDAVSTKPVDHISSSSYRLLSAVEQADDEQRKAILDYAVFQLRENERRANLIRDARSQYLPSLSHNKD